MHVQAQVVLQDHPDVKIRGRWWKVRWADNQNQTPKWCFWGDMAHPEGMPGAGRLGGQTQVDLGQHLLSHLPSTCMASSRLDWTRTWDCYTFTGNQKGLGNSSLEISGTHLRVHRDWKLSPLLQMRRGPRTKDKFSSVHSFFMLPDEGIMKS